MQVILAGSLIFDLVDRLTCHYMSLGHESDDYLEYFGGGKNPFNVIAKTPGAWLVVNIIIFLAMARLLIMYMRHLGSLATGTLTTRMELNRKIDVSALHRFLRERHLECEEEAWTLNTRYRKVSWFETDKLWGKKKPKVELTYDIANGFILKCFLTVDRNNGFWSQDELEKTFLEFLDAQGLFPKPQDNPLRRSIFDAAKEQERPPEMETLSKSFVKGGDKEGKDGGGGGSGKEKSD